MAAKSVRPSSMRYEQESRAASLQSLRYSQSIHDAPSSEHPRSALKIRLDILQAVGDHGASKVSKIIFLANLSQERSVKYLTELVSLGLLSEERSSVSKSYSLTARGLEFVNQVKQMEVFVAGFGLSI